MDGVYYNELLALYGGLLTENHRAIAEAYYGLDLSLGEIAEIRGVSRQSVSDALSATRAKLTDYESKLRLYAKKVALYRLFESSSDGRVATTDIKKALGEF